MVTMTRYASKLTVAVFAAVFTTLSLASIFSGTAFAQNNAESHWLTAWSAAPDSPGDPLKPQTLRQTVRLSADGSAIRLRFSNLFGNAPLTLGPVHVALHDKAAAIVAGSDQVITFNGKPTITIAKGADVVSDKVPFKVGAAQEITVSLYLPATVKSPTIHTLAMQVGYATPGKEVTAATVIDGTPLESRFFLTDVEVEGSNATGLVVTIGDSITDGMASTIDANNRWPDLVTNRLLAQGGSPLVAVVNTGLIGNRILHDGLGPKIMSRFDRDALNKAGVTKIILEAGINDIGTTKPNVTAQQVIDAMQLLIARAHAKHIQIAGTTLMPFKGSQFLDYTAVAEKKRQQVNQWIRSSGAFDLVIDFDAAMGDPTHPEQLLAKYDSGDHTHPNAAGYQLLAALVDLKWLGMR